MRSLLRAGFLTGLAGIGGGMFLALLLAFCHLPPPISSMSWPPVVDILVLLGDCLTFALCAGLSLVICWLVQPAWGGAVGKRVLFAVVVVPVVLASVVTPHMQAHPAFSLMAFTILALLPVLWAVLVEMWLTIRIDFSTMSRLT